MAAYKIRRFLLVIALLGVPALTLGVAPPLLDLIQRVEELENTFASFEQPVSIVDANGTEVGTFLGVDGRGGRFGQDAAVAVKVENGVFYIGIADDDFQNTDSLQFISADCSGQPYVFASQFDEQRNTSLFGARALGAPGHTIYLPSGDPTQFVFQSQLGSGGTCSTCGVNTSCPTVAIDHLPVEPLVDLAQIFTAPFGISLPGGSL